MTHIFYNCIVPVCVHMWLINFKYMRLILDDEDEDLKEEVKESTKEAIREGKEEAAEEEHEDHD